MTALDSVRDAATRLNSRIIANAHLLDRPFSDQPDLSPWLLIKRDMAVLQAALERLKASQLPDGGQWETVTGELDADGRFWQSSRGIQWRTDTHQRRIWTSPVEPIPAQSDSAGLATSDPDSATQTTPRPA